MAEIKDFAEKLVNLSVKDVNELANILKEEYGIEPAAAAVAVAGPATGGGDDAGDAKTEFDVVLTAAGYNLWFDAFKTLKFIHYFQSHGFQQVPINDACRHLELL